MKQRTRYFTLTLLLAALTGLILIAGLTQRASRAAGPVCTVDHAGGVGVDYATIGAAIADSGCTTINVAAGVYTENLTIDRDLTLQGAGAGVTVIDGNGQVTHRRGWHQQQGRFDPHRRHPDPQRCERHNIQ
jgi:pectin methylesterase-like acyl-CoA thioesterase